MEITAAEREIDDIIVIVGLRTEEHSLSSQVRIGSESDCLLGQLERIVHGYFRFSSRPKR